MTTIFLKSTFEEPSETVRAAALRGEVAITEQTDFTAEMLMSHKGLITGNQLDQNAMLALKDALASFLDHGGHWFFNGHMARPLVDGIGQYRSIVAPKRQDFGLSSINPHPLYDGIDLKKIETNRGVAGFYGRGCNPPPEGAVAVNGLGPARVPVDWVWARPRGGRFFSHAGNDLGTIGLEWNLAPDLTRRVINWANGGSCLSSNRFVQTPPVEDLPLARAESYGGARDTGRAGPRIVAPSSGTYYHIHSLEGSAYTGIFDVICAPEDLVNVLRPQDILWVPCRTPAQRMIKQRAVIARHLDAGGTVIALGESQSELWLPAVHFTRTPTNWWWWLTPGADLGVELTDQARTHPLMRHIGKQDVTWHLHGWFTPPEGSTVLARDGEGRAILYMDAISTAGTMVISSLDPMYHHGSRFMPATTRFLDRFAPNLRACADA